MKVLKIIGIGLIFIFVPFIFIILGYKLLDLIKTHRNNVLINNI